MNHAMAYDAGRGVVVMFGGTDGASGLRETWERSGTDWTLVSTTGPSKRQGHAMADDPQRGAVILNGGGASKDTTWEWDGATWTRIVTDGPRFTEHTMVYDAVNAAPLIFGGNGAYLGGGNETWLLHRPGPLAGDVNGDRAVTLTDLAILLSNFGLPGGATREDGDLNGDGAVDLTDLSLVLANFDTTCS